MGLNRKMPFSALVYMDQIYQIYFVTLYYLISEIIFLHEKYLVLEIATGLIRSFDMLY